MSCVLPPGLPEQAFVPVVTPFRKIVGDKYARTEKRTLARYRDHYSVGAEPALSIAGQVRETDVRGAPRGRTGEGMNRTMDVNDKYDDAPLDPAAVLAEFPELRRLIDLLRAGWQFRPISSGGELIEVRGLRVWPDEWVDAMAIRFTTDATGLRCDRSRGVVWEQAGDLADVVNGLLVLPAPSDPASPRRVLRTTTRLWTQ